MKPFNYIFLLLLICASCYSQGEANNWYFGNGAGIKFMPDGSVVPLSGGQIFTLEGCSSISNSDGDLLFYSDGRNVWDRNHVIMPNGNYNAGTGLLGDPSSTQSAIIVPKPGNPNIYYIFTVDEPHNDNAAVFPDQNTNTGPDQDDGFNNGLTYSVVDLSITGNNGSIGNVTTRNVFLTTYDPLANSEAKYKCSEKITAVKNNNGSGYWVITHFVDKFYAFKIDSNGVDLNPVISVIGPTVSVNGYRRNSIGYLKSSPDGRKIAIAHNQLGNTTGGTTENGQVLLHDFNNSTGVVSNSITVINGGNPYGVEFSADSKKLYATNGLNNSSISRLIQFDLTVSPLTPVIIEESNASPGALQLGPNKKIYRANSSSQSNISSHIGVINQPEINGLACNYQQMGVPLIYGTSSLGLPPFITSVFNTSILVSNTCFGDATQFSIPENPNLESIVWDFGDGTTSSQLSPTHVYGAPGDYTVTVTVTVGGAPITNEQIITIHEVPTAVPLPNQILNQCDDDGDQIYTFDFSTLSGLILGSQDPTFYEVKYFLTNQDAIDDSNAVNSTSFTNTTPVFEIYARVTNKNNQLCYDITNFTVNVFKGPVINSLTDYNLCDDTSDGNAANGQTTFNLSLLNNGILGTQNAGEFTISYHLNQNDADLDTNPQPLSFYNTIPFQQPLVVRIENNLNSNCYTTSVFNLIVNPLPNAVPAQLTQCDFQLNPDGFTTFNLSEANSTLTGNNPNYSTEFYAQGNPTALNPIYTNIQNPQILTVHVIDNSTGCYAATTLTLTVNTNPTTHVPLRKCDDDGTEDGFTEFNLSDAGFEQPGNTTNYYLSSNDALLEENEIGQPVNFTNTVADTQQIYVRIENGNDCIGINVIDLFVDPLPNIDIDDEAVFCLNQPTVPVTLDAGIGLQNPNLFTYLWSPGGETTPSIDVLASGTYTVTVTNSLNCFKERTIVVKDSDIAVIESVYVLDLSDNNTITIYVQGDEDEFEYSLDSPTGPFQSSNHFENVTPGIHTVYVNDIDGCGVIPKEILVLGIPKFFTPNGDGYNDTWKIIGMEQGFYTNSKIYIFDRYGKLLKQMAPNGEGWNGIFNGQPLPSTDYWYMLNLEDGRTVKGHFTLKR
ncbi:MAG TPA: T9SS type B sorting domain-containing protein [Flavobacterium sp.]|uniref:T9SS type B sorting domain-containing protein n=1 Tax=Flavobacterium sp. TaxID=239 RepID=UPI002B834BC8|nr:T9SS type B sorting domain-containing protein [Flavobacterium sp.]HSD13687.1 T9SS type B sorting domain-containing protein [Flavobacterium sp.]